MTFLININNNYFVKKNRNSMPLVVTVQRLMICYSFTMYKLQNMGKSTSFTEHWKRTS